MDWSKASEKGILALTSFLKIVSDRDNFTHVLHTADVTGATLDKWPKSVPMEKARPQCEEVLISSAPSITTSFRKCLQLPWSGHVGLVLHQKHLRRQHPDYKHFSSGLSKKITEPYLQLAKIPKQLLFFIALPCILPSTTNYISLSG